MPESKVDYDEIKRKIRKLASMNKDEFKNVVSEFFFCIYYRFYKENGIVNIPLYDPDILAQMGLPIDADGNTIFVIFLLIFYLDCRKRKKMLIYTKTYTICEFRLMIITRKENGHLHHFYKWRVPFRFSENA